MEPITANTDTQDGELSEVEQLKEELKREHDLYLRARAEFDNYRKRVERERASAARAGKRDIILSLLKVLDNFDFALDHLKDASPAVLEGMRAIERQMVGVLEAQGITSFESVGQPFDPTLNEAIASVESDEYEPGTVLDELRRGYRWGDEVLRPAQVRVVREKQ